MNEAERLHAAYAETPAGQIRRRLGVTEQADPTAAAQFVAERQIAHKHAYGREYGPDEVRALEFAAERATTQVSYGRPTPKTSWDWAQEMRWGVESPPPQDAALGSLEWIAVPR